MSTQDGWEEVSRPSYEFLSKLSQSPELLRFSAIDLLKKNLYQSIQSLSRLSHTGNDQQMSKLEKDLFLFCFLSFNFFFFKIQKKVLL